MNHTPILAEQFKFIHDKLESHINQKLRDVDLTFSQLQVLKYLKFHRGERVTQKDIGDYMKLKHSTVIGILQRMEAKGLVVSCTDEENRRGRNISMTDKAEELDQEIYSHCREMDKRLVRYLDDEEQKMLQGLLGRVLKGVTEETE